MSLSQRQDELLSSVLFVPDDLLPVHSDSCAFRSELVNIHRTAQRLRRNSIRERTGGSEIIRKTFNKYFDPFSADFSDGTYSSFVLDAALLNLPFRHATGERLKTSKCHPARTVVCDFLSTHQRKQVSASVVTKLQSAGLENNPFLVSINLWHKTQFQKNSKPSDTT